MQRLLAPLFAVLLVVPPLPSEPAATGPVATEVLEYVSDFLCFTGGDDQGRVAFAFDANRGRKGERFQAEHFGALWVEGRGWVELKGTGEFEDPDQRFRELPSSPAWQVEGDAAAGISVVSESNGLELRVDPLSIVTRRSLEGASFDTGSTRASLRLGERELEGVVTYEYCFLPDINPLAKTYTDLFGDGFHGVYAVVGQPAGGEPLRFHDSGGRLEPLILSRDGFVGGGEQAQRVEEARFRISNRSLGGFFRWPGRYRVDWGEPESGPRFDLRIKDRKTLFNYVFGGVAVAIVDGALTRDGAEQPVFGFALIVR